MRSSAYNNSTTSLTVVAGDGVTLTPSDPLFLSDPTFGTTANGVPQPWTLSLLAAGLIAQLAYGRKKRR